MQNKNFLEGHLASALLRRKNATEDRLASRPSFPPPTRVERTEEDKDKEEPTAPSPSSPEATTAPVEEKSTQALPYVGAPSSTNSTVTYIRTTKGEDLHDYLDSESVWQEKAKQLAALLKEAKCLVIYTGAGISTKAKIPDYRSMDGVWTNLEKGLAPPEKIDLETATPTMAHMAIAELIKQGLCKLLVSTNIDGLHRRSGVDYEHIAELHGNCYREVCEQCGAEYLRNFSTIKDGQKEGHYTGRSCDKCDGKLKDSIINFGESLPERDFQLASKVSLDADLTLVIGSSMRVSPACNMPRQTLNKPSFKPGQAPGKMVLINKQKTPFEDEAWLHIFADIDDVLQEVMRHLEVSIPSFAEHS